MKILFWISAIAVLYTYLGYPLLLLVLRVFIRRPVRRAPIEPFVSLIVPAHNEARVIEEKLRNVTALNYPREKLEIIVASDGSTDNTVHLAEAFEGSAPIRVLPFPQNRGKMAVLNDAVRAATGEILLFSDASAMLQPDALQHLVSNFADPEVGAVSGLYRIVHASEATLGVQEDFYWKYETFLKSLESSVSSTIGAHGQILALRKCLYPYPDHDVINDDHVIPMRVLATASRVIYDGCAIACEKASEMTGFQRRVRVMAGNLQQLSEMQGLLCPIQVLPLIFVISRKTLRTLVPAFLIFLALSNLFLLRTDFYRITALCQLAFYALASAGVAWNLRPSVLRMPYYFCSINAAYLWSVLQFPLGLRRLKWE